MKTSIYEYNDYKAFLCDVIASGGRGKRKEIAEAIRCQVSHVSMVLSGNGHFTQEQAEGIARYFGLTAMETEFLLLLLQFNRAGTKTLKSVYRNMLDQRRAKYATLGNRLKMATELTPRDEMIYYSSWHYAAIHVLISIPDFQTRESISDKLKIPLPRCDEVLNFLMEHGFCSKNGVRFLPAKPRLHLEKNSPLIGRFHSNWRIRAMQAYDEITEGNFHYSGTFSLSEKDLPKLKKILSDALLDFMKVVTESPEETLGTLCIDLFPM